LVAVPFGPSTSIRVTFIWFSFALRVRPHHVDQGMLFAWKQGE
jgi:hypothetical protein